ncbi:unnamed protein product [Onchocerca ochengi]|uniref:Uncharacterized protein n=1 Tax=Onchocerca ochengi TaxID=42157 RepID=A0A182EX27_ONCOC|nr:unnamed protein product [Onchocerca ochengi]
MVEKPVEENEQEEPIALTQEVLYCTWKAILLIALVFILPVKAEIGEDCTWISGVIVTKSWNSSSYPQELRYTHEPTIDLDSIEHCTTQSKVCTTSNSIFLWDEKEATSKCLYRKIGTYEAQIYGDYVIIDELQTSFVSAEQNETASIANCGFIEPYFMDGDIIIDKGNKNSISNRDSKAANQETNNNPVQKEQIIMTEMNSEMHKDPENAKFQYPVHRLNRTSTNG